MEIHKKGAKTKGEGDGGLKVNDSDHTLKELRKEGQGKSARPERENAQKKRRTKKKETWGDDPFSTQASKALTPLKNGESKKKRRKGVRGVHEKAASGKERGRGSRCANDVVRKNHRDARQADTCLRIENP